MLPLYINEKENENVMLGQALSSRSKIAVRKEKPSRTNKLEKLRHFEHHFEMCV